MGGPRWAAAWGVALLVVVWWLGAAGAAVGAVFTQVSGSPFATGAAPVSVAFSPGGGLLATANDNDDTVSVFSVDQSTGALTQVSGSPFATGSEPLSVAFSPGGGLLATANAGGNDVSVFSVDQSTGALTQVSGSPFATGSNPRSVAFSPGGGLLATANSDPNGTANDVSVFSVDQSTGALTQVSGSPFATGRAPDSVAFSPGGGLLATANEAAATVSVFSVDQSTGALTQVSGSPFATGSDPFSVAFSPGGGLLATANYFDGDVSVFSVDQSTGALTQVSGSPFTTAMGATGAEPASVAFSPVGGLLATADTGSNDMSVFSVDQSTGALTQVSDSPFATGSDPFSVAFSPGGGLLAIANSDDNTVSVFSIVDDPLSIAKSFSPSSIAAGGTSTLTFTITNPAADTVTQTGVAFSDSLPSGLVVATPNGLSNSCGGTVGATAGSGSISLSGGSVGVNSNCTIVVNVTGSSGGVFSNTTGPVSSTNGGTGNTASDLLTVVAPPSIAESFSPSSVPVGGASVLTFTITNPAADTVTQTGVAFTDSLPSGVVVATPNGLSNSCGGTVGATAGSGSISLSGGSVVENLDCSVAVNVTSATAGTYSNTSGAVSSTNGGTGNTATAGLRVTKASPSLLLRAPARGTAGAAISPSAVSTALSGGFSPSGTITFKVFGPRSRAPNDCSAGATVGSASVLGNGTYSPSLGFTPMRVGDYWWYARYAGDANNKQAGSKCGASMVKTIVISPLVVVKVTVSGTTARVSLACRSSATNGCPVQLTLKTTNRADTLHVVTVGQASATLTAGQANTVPITLNDTGQRLLAKRGSLETKLIVTQSPEVRITKIVTFH